MSKDADINNFIDRSFRDIADQDYISARMSFHYYLFIPFIWLASQAIEKYLKAILLYNRKNTKNLGHDISKIYHDIPKKISNISLSFIDQDVEEFIERIDVLCKGGSIRYFENSYFITGNELLNLDKTIWHLRKHCFYGGNQKNRFLEKVINLTYPKYKDLKKQLMWRNSFFGKGRKWPLPLHSTLQNPTHRIEPDIFTELEKLVQFSKNEKAYFCNGLIKNKNKKKGGEGWREKLF